MDINKTPTGIGKPNFKNRSTKTNKLDSCVTETWYAGIPPNMELVHKGSEPF